MSLFDAFILGVLQGITEFLPISSSGHLIILETFLKLPLDQTKGFDVALHFGTLLAIFCYFWKDFRDLIKAFLSFIIPRKKMAAGIAEASRSLVKYLILATLPAIAVGLFLNDYLDEMFRSAKSVAVVLIIVGVLFFVVEAVARKKKHEPFTFSNTFLIGIAQAVALIPGVSRSGATISAGLVQGIKREEAARFSFLLGSIAITAATVLSVYKVWKGEFVLPGIEILLVGIITSFVSGLVVVAFLMKFLKKHTLNVFGVYRILLGIVLLLFF